MKKIEAAFHSDLARCRKAFAPITGDERPVLIENRNDRHTIALLKAALDVGLTAGIIETADLRTLDTQSGPAEGTHLLNKCARLSDGPGLVCFTSGSTGSPKGIMRSLDSWVQSFAVQWRATAFDRRAAVTIIGNLSHSMHSYAAIEALERDIVPSVLGGFSPEAALKALVADEAGILHATPAHLLMILRHAASRTIQPVETLSHVFVGGARLGSFPFDALRKVFPNADIVEFFGTSETSFIAIKDPEAPSGSVGKACPGVDLKILGASGAPCPAGTEGQLWIRSPMLFDRYVAGDDPNTCWQDGFVTVGDQGYLDENGNLFFTSRKGTMVTIAGENVFLEPVEAAIAPLIRDIPFAIVAIPDALRGSRLVLATGTGLSPDLESRILQTCRRLFGPLKAPKAVIIVNDWPLTGSGKTDRKRLQERLERA